MEKIISFLAIINLHLAQTKKKFSQSAVQNIWIFTRIKILYHYRIKSWEIIKMSQALWIKKAKKKYKNIINNTEN